MGSFAAVAQEGHPLDGTWHGDWGTSASQRTRLFLMIHWTGKELTGTLNPGPNAVPMTVTMDPDGWKVHLEATVGGQKMMADGAIDVETIGSYNRVISGTWQQGSQRGDFRITRD